jgi:hypothetical protein
MTTSNRASGTNTQAASTRAAGTGQQQTGMGQQSMGQQSMGQRSGAGQRGGEPSMSSMLARGGSILAASLLFLLGVYHFFAGIAGFARNNFYTVGQNYPYQASSTAWGWIHVIGGVLLVLTSLALFSRTTTWARPVAIVLVLASAVANFFFLAYFPLWAILMIALATFCIWALVRDGQDQRAEEFQRTQQQYAMQQYGPPQTGLGAQQHAGAYGTGQGQREQAGTGAYVSSAAGQRWPENAGGREESQRGSSPSDMKEGANRGQEKAQEKAQEHAQSGTRGAQSGRNQPNEEQSRQSGRDYRSR